MEKIKILKSFSLLFDLSEEELATLAHLLKEQAFPPKTTFITQDDVSDAAYFVYEGGVKVFRITEGGEEVSLAVLGPGEIVGEMSLIDDQPRSAYVETIQETKVLVLEKSEFIKTLTIYPIIAIKLLKTLSLKLRSTSQNLEDVMSKNLIERTWKTLLTLSSYFPNGDITLSQEELSLIIGATRSRVTEALNQLEKEGKISLSHKKIHIF